MQEQELLQFQNKTLDLFAAPIGKIAVLSIDYEPALFQNTAGCNIMFGNMRIKGARLYDIQKFRERLRGNALTPEFLSNPVADFPFDSKLEADNVAGDLSIEEDSLCYDGVISHDLCPMRHEGVPVPGGKGSHRGCIRVELVLEENGEVRFCYSAEEDFTGHVNHFVLSGASRFLDGLVEGRFQVKFRFPNHPRFDYETDEHRLFAQRESAFQRGINVIQMFAAVQGTYDPAFVVVINFLEQFRGIILQPLIQRL